MYFAFEVKNYYTLIVNLRNNLTIQLTFRFIEAANFTHNA